MFTTQKPQPLVPAAPAQSNRTSTPTESGGLVSRRVSIKGSVKFRNELLIDAEVEGTINSTGNLTIGEHARTRKLLESLRHAVLLFVSHVPDEILSEQEKKDWKMRPGKMEMRWIGVVDDDGNVIGRYISISNTSTGGFPRVPATQIWQHDPRTNTVHWQEAPKPFAKKAVRMWLEQKGVRAERHVPISGQM